MIKVVKIISSIVLFIVFGVGIFYFATNESKPGFKVETIAEADEMANRMLTAINVQAWDSTQIVQWSFKEIHDFVWDKEHNYIQVKWDENEVRLNLDNRSEYVVFTNEVKITDSAASFDLSVQAWKYFCNDSFWLNAPAKVYDIGTKRSIVIEDGVKALMVSYESGGDTPGDSYVWFLDDNFRPYKYKMWASIIPIGGIEATWAEWEELPSKAMIATEHEMAVFKILIKNLKSAQSLEEIGLDQDLFKF